MMSAVYFWTLMVLVVVVVAAVGVGRQVGVPCWRMLAAPPGAHSAVLTVVL